MSGRTAATLLLVFTVLFALSAAGCGVGGQETAIEQSESESRMVVISGRVQVKGDLHGSELKLSATPVPGPVGPLKGSRTLLAIRPSSHQAHYEFKPLPLQVDYHVTRTDREALRPASKATVAKTYVIDHYLVRLAPPPGWSVEPDHYEVHADTTTADFVLRRR